MTEHVQHPSVFVLAHAYNLQVTSLNSMSLILEDALREYNETHATMDLVLFEDAMKHVSQYVGRLLLSPSQMESAIIILVYQH